MENPDTEKGRVRLSPEMRNTAVLAVFLFAAFAAGQLGRAPAAQVADEDTRERIGHDRLLEKVSWLSLLFSLPLRRCFFF